MVAAKTLPLLMFAVAASAVSCSYDDEDGYALDQVLKSYGMIDRDADDTGAGFSIKLDDGTSLNILSNLIPSVEVDYEERVYVNYTILGDVPSRQSGTKKHYIRLNGLTKVLSKAPSLRSFIESDPDKLQFREDSLGYSPVKMLMSWTGGRYLNVNFAIMRKQGSEDVHLISLLHDDVEQGPNGEVILTLRHNAYRDTPSQDNTVGFEPHEAIVSFDILYLASSVRSDQPVKIKLKWREYSENTWTEGYADREYDLTFTPYVNNTGAKSVMERQNKLFIE